MHCVRSMFHGFPQCLDIVSFQSFQVSIGNYGSRVVSNHTTSVSRTCPFRQESAFFISVHQSFLHLRIHGWIHQVKEWEKTTERIPETGIGKHIARKHFAIIRTVVHHVSFGIYLIETSGEQYRTIQAGVECTQMVDIIVFHFDTSQYIVPYLAAFRCNLFNIVRTQLFQVQFRLFRADKRGSYTHIYLFALAGFETDQCTGMIVCRFQFVGVNHTTGYGSRISKRFVEYQYKVVFKVGRNTTAVFSGITDNLVLRRDYFHKRTFIKGVYHYIRVVVFGESETESSRSLCRSNFGHYIMIGKIYFIIIRSSRFSFMREPTGTLILIKYCLTGYRHDGKLTVIIDPRTWLMGLFESSDLVSVIRIGPSITHFTSLRNPKVHSPGQRNGRVSISGR